MAENVTLSGKQRRAIIAFLSEPSVEAVSAKTGVSTRTLWRWLKQPAFAAALEKARTQQSEDALTLLRGTLGKAVATARDLLDSPNPATALKAAALLLDHGLKLRAEQSMPIEKVMKLQSLLIDLAVSAMRDLNLPEAALRGLMAKKFTALREAGYPVIDVDLSDLSNGHAH